MNVFELQNNKVVIHPEAYSLKPFKDIWNADKTKDKSKAIKELAFIYWYCDFKSDFSDILNEEDKQHEIKNIIGLPEKWKPTKKIEDAIEFYKDRQRTSSMYLLEAAQKFTQKLKEFYETVDLNEKDQNGKYLHNIPQLQKGISELASQTEALRKLKETVSKEIEEQSRIRGGGDIGYFEDPD